MKMVFTCLLFLQMACVLSMSIVNKSFVQSQEDRFQNLENVVKELSNQIQLLNTTHSASTLGSAEKEPVLFYAVTTSSLHLERKSTVVFDKAQINYGGHYNEFDGIFVSPATGIYMFSWTVCTIDKNYIFTELVVENSIISIAGEYETQGYRHCGSMTALCKVNINDHAWIRTTSYSHNSQLHYLYLEVNTGTNSFMGILLHRE